jgi:hypothetical protein
MIFLGACFSVFAFADQTALDRWKKPEKIFSGGKGGCGPPNFDQRMFQKGGEGFAPPPQFGPARKPIADLAIFCAGKRQQTPARAGVRRGAPSVLRVLLHAGTHALI